MIRIDDAFTGTRDFVGEVNIPEGVEKIEFVVLFAILGFKD